MAEKRMFSKTITKSDAFLEMPATTRCLYYALSMDADDDGFVNNPKGIMRMNGCTEDDMKVLIAKKFVLVFESGVIVIKHWRINNYLRGDRYKETNYVEEKAMLSIEENGAYTMNPCATTLSDPGIPPGIPTVDHPVYPDKSREEENREEENRLDEIRYIVGYLNEITGSHYKPTTDKTKSCIRARFREGFTVEDFETVIRKMAGEWGSDPKMARFLRPETLFGNKFEGYLNAPEAVQKPTAWGVIMNA